MRLRALHIQQLPGVDAFRVADLAPGANLITGPNAVGKSSLTRALRFLIGGPHRDDPAALSLVAEFDGADTGHQWQVRRTGSSVVWTHNGQVADPPPLPGRDLLHCYWLRVEDLLKIEGSDDQALVQRLQRDLFGGVDLDAIRRSEPFRSRERIDHNKRRDLRTARATRQEVENGYQVLLRDEARLPALEHDAKRAKAAARRVERIDAALRLLEAGRDLQRESNHLAEFPPGMDRLHGDEIERLTDLETDRDARADAREQARRTLRGAGARLAETGLAAARPTAADLQIQREHLTKADDLTQRCREARDELARARAEENQAAADLGGTNTPPRLNPETVKRAEDVASRLSKARHGRDKRQENLDAFDGPGDSETRDTGRTRRALPGALALAGGIAAAAVAALVPTWLGLVTALVAAGAGLWSLLDARRQGAGSRADADFRARRREELANELKNAESTLGKIEQEQRNFRAEYGLDPAPFDGAGLDRFIRLASALDTARGKRGGIEQRIGGYESEIAEHASCVHDFLVKWQAASNDKDVATLKATLDAFAKRHETAGQARSDCQQAEREIANLDEQLQGIDGKIRQLFEDVALEPGERTALKERCDRYAEWQDGCQKRDSARSIQADRRQLLGNETELLALVDADDEDGLNAERASQQQCADEYERLGKEIGNITTRLEVAGGKQELERAVAGEHQAADALEDRFDQAMLAEAGQFLLDEITAEYKKEHEPAVLQDARERFSRFTHHGWSLEMNPDKGFYATEAASGERRQLEELSSGTRMQLLLAVRMAWARQIEREKEPLPLFLDEALTTSDERRFHEVAQSLDQLVRDEGRQVFYLSARRQEIALWERATGHRPHVVDLAALRFARPDAQAEDYALPPLEPLPLPDGHGAESYAAALDVPPVDPRQSPNNLHLFYLLRDDLSRLHGLMEQWRIARLGPLESLLASEAADKAIPDPTMRATLTARCHAARAWIGAWRRGRGKPVDRGVLEQSEIVSATFIDRVAALAEQQGGDAEALVKALRAGEVPRFRGNTIDELAEWLLGEAYIDPAEPLDADERERHTVQTASAHAPPDEIRRVVHWLEGRENTITQATPPTPLAKV